MIAAHGTRVTVTNDQVVLTPTPLTASLSGNSADRTVAVSSITEIEQFLGDEWEPSLVTVRTSSGALDIQFSPGDSAGAAELAAQIEKARGGDAPDAGAAPDGAAGIPGFDFVALDVETANQNWGSICQIGLVKYIDGEEVARESWTCCPPESIGEFDPVNVGIHGITPEKVAGCPGVGELLGSLAEFVGELPLVAHNAQFDASALRYACLATGAPVPPMMFACTLALARATQLDVVNHKLPTLAEHFGVALDKHHDAASDAAACAGILVGLARAAGYEGSVMGFVHDAGFALGSIDADRVTPVLRDRSGATRALQARGLHAVVEPEGNNQDGGPSGDSRRGGGGTSQSKKPQRSAPWQAVATPDEIPEPNAEADPDSPLYGENVTLTGDFEPFEKGELWAGIAQQGAQVGKNVTKKTTILVAGSWATMTTKEKRARELQEKGQDIQIWTADQLLEALGYD